MAICALGPPPATDHKVPSATRRRRYRHPAGPWPPAALGNRSVVACVDCPASVFPALVRPDWDTRARRREYRRRKEQFTVPLVPVKPAGTS